MCGIAGLLGVDLAVARPAAERMQAALRHRGPDDQGIEIVAGPAAHRPAVLVHTRLSIVDLSPGGHQPMADRPSRPGLVPNVVTFNGEIYNYRELVPELERAGWPCRTRSDTEALLHAYRVWGPRAVERFEGMFVFCLLDPERGLAWFCRDRVGIKPIYLYRPASGGLLFASEVRALLAAGSALVPPRLHRPALESFFAQGAVMSETSIVEGVTLLAPGESLLCDFDGRPQRGARYWSVSFGNDAGADERAADGSIADVTARRLDDAQPARWRSEVVAELGAALRTSLSKLLLADVPVGMFLSSGVDSQAVAAIASEVSSRPLRTISVGFDVPELDETRPAAESARDLGTEHAEIVLSGASVLASFDAALAAVDQPSVDGFNTFYISRAARQAGLTVALSGLGGDELFGGYASFRDVPRALKLRHVADGLPSAVRSALASGLDAAAGLPLWNGRGRLLAKLGATLTRPTDLVSLYFLRRELFVPAKRRALHALPGGCDPHTGIETDRLADLRASHFGREPLDRIAMLEFSTYMRHMLLRDADVFSMAHGLEIRVPLLEHYAVVQAARARSSWRRPDPRPKPLLIDAAGPRLPPRSWRAKKRGFTFPWQGWLEGPLRTRAEERIHGTRFAEAGLTQSAVEGVWRAFAAGDPRVSPLEIIALLVLGSYLDRHQLAV